MKRTLNFLRLKLWNMFNNVKAIEIDTFKRLRENVTRKVCGIVYEVYGINVRQFWWAKVFDRISAKMCKKIFELL